MFGKMFPMLSGEVKKEPPLKIDRVEQSAIVQLLTKQRPEAIPAPNKPITVAIIGAGMRGKGYAYYALENRKWMRVVAVAEPVNARRQRLAEDHHIPNEHVFEDWRELARLPKFCDAVVICTLDSQHFEPAIAFADLKYHILLEKPMAPSLQECYEITRAALRNQVVFTIAHVLRYTAHNRVINQMIDSGVLGDIINIQHVEPVGFWHFAHSYVRGNWRKESESSFSLMTKSCHDIDLIAQWMHSPCVRISSFGNLTHFKRENKPEEAGKATRCLECAHEKNCQYSAKSIYLDPASRGQKMWPISVLADVVDIESVDKALREGPYGRCVYECDNDVVDHQVVNMEFASGATASCTMVAFTKSVCVRETKIFGTKGQLDCDGMDSIRFDDFVTGTREVLTPSKITGMFDMRGHGGGDIALVEAFLKEIATVSTRDGATEAFNSHLYVFAAEHARRTGQVVNIEQFKQQHQINI
ncbi:8279_t:CDS:10 [Paraglomus brasilianum]|uniref:8279_t:CDS:1 n=1 Tax=Paraglomus brasilianum TaxID=144538 RepID=A0A9N8ZZA1_9GLOM|nr:8279_t:CDS:10 [Paraglomus brasilianum]